jgi:hypothetical protein
MFVIWRDLTIVIIGSIAKHIFNIKLHGGIVEEPLHLPRRLSLGLSG